jgi:DNA-binding transcriptional ArsR family regulator
MLQSLRQFKAEIFQALGHPTRIAIVEYLRAGEISVGQLCEKVGIEQANASQHLAVLRSKHIVETRKEGNQIFYRLRNPLVGDMLEMMRQYFFEHMNEAMEMLRQEKRESTKAMHKEDKVRNAVRR